MNNKKYIDRYSGKEKSTRYLRFKNQRRKEKNKIIECSSGYPNAYTWSEEYQEYILPNYYSKRGYGPIDLEVGRYFPTKKAYPKRWYRGKGSSEYKKISHRKVRRSKIEYIGKSNISNREFDFWWILF